MKILDIDPYNCMFNAHNVKFDDNFIYILFDSMQKRNFKVPIDNYFKIILFNKTIHLLN